jgi:putative transposase
MARPFSLDLRERIVGAVEAGRSRRAAAAMFAVSESCAIKLVQRWKRTGSVAASAMGSRKPFALAAHADRVRSLVAAQPDATIDELHARLTDEGIAVGRSAVDRFLRALGLTRKKRRSMPPSRIGRTSRPRGQRGAAPSPR